MHNSIEKLKVIILGIGNPLRSDDGVGIHVIEALRKESLPTGTDLLEGLTGLDIIGAIKGCDKVIIVDAIMTASEPGTIFKLSLQDLSITKTLHHFSTHEMDFPSMLELGKKIFPGQIAEDITIIAIQAEDVTTISEKCTPEVEKSIREVVQLIKELLQ